MKQEKKEKKVEYGKLSQITDYTFNFKPGNSFFYKLHPVCKIVWFILMTCIVLIQTSLIILSVLMLVVFITARVNGITFHEILRKLRWIILMVIIMVILNIFFNAIPSGSEEILFYIWYPYIPVRRLAVYFALKVGIWVLTLSTSGIIFLITTQPKDLVYGLRDLKIPYKLAFSMMVGLRYVPLVQDTTNAVIIAQKARGLERANIKRSLRRALELIKDRLSTSLILTMRNARYSAISMELRAFGRYKDRTDLYKLKFFWRDTIFLALLTFLTIFLILYQFNFLPFLPQVPSIYHLIWG
ncbi:MAG TPA: energy-coupling factor transporter transmembrane component T [Candidatus Deferrimicrobium sp.]|nr:energy-coupling factor transporter transmembrane component T [Candidatus Deferrimicrobium sp.]